jgi:putative transcriptional regulator
MKKEMFEELIASVKEAGAIMRGEKKASRIFEVAEIPDVKKIRRHYKLSQDKFAALMGISAGTLRGWEQKRRKPEGPARVLLQIAARHPRVLLELASGRKPKKRSMKIASAV